MGVVTPCLIIVAALWAALIFYGSQSEKLAIKQGRSDASNLTMALRENVRGTISAIDQLMIAIIEENNESGQDFHIPAWVEKSSLVNKVGVQVGIIGPDGVAVVSSLGLAGRLDLSDRPHFRYHLDPSAAQPYISAPVLDRISGKWSIQVTRRIARRDGSFGGVIVVSIDPHYFSKFFYDLDVGQYGVIDLVGLDGIVRARRSHDTQDPAGQDLSRTSLFVQLRSSNAGTEIVHSKLDGLTRVYGYSVVPEYPLVVTVGLATDDLLAGVNQQRKLYFIGGGILTVVIAILGWFLAGEITRRRERELAAHAEEKTREQKVLLDTALNNMSQGLLMFDSHGRMVVSNRRYVDLYELSADAVQPGCTLNDLLRQRKEKSSFTGNIEQYCADIHAAIAQKKTRSLITQLPNGRSIRIINHPLETGGWVATHEDISEQRRAEQELDDTKKFLNSIIENIPIAIVVKDAKTRKFVLVNRAFEEMLDLPRSKLLGLTLFEIYSARYAALVDEADNECMLNAAGTNYHELELETPNRGLRIHATNRIVMRDHNDDPKYLVVVIEDITDRKKSEQQIAFMAHHDALTGLANRAALTQKIEEAAGRQRRFGDPFGILVLDLDRFKYVNDTLGHPAGDALLREVAIRLKASLRETDVLARLGGDEFAIIQGRETDQLQAASTLAGRIIEIIAKPFCIDGTDVHIAASIGIALAPDHATDADSLLKMADMALYGAKSAGRNGYRFFDFGHERGGERTPRARERFAPRHRARRTGTALSADHRRQDEQDLRRRDADTLAASHQRHDSARSIYSISRGNRIDHADRGMGAA